VKEGGPHDPEGGIAHIRRGVNLKEIKFGPGGEMVPERESPLSNGDRKPTNWPEKGRYLVNQDAEGEDFFQI